jgi:ankyrin repeat protein
MKYLRLFEDFDSYDPYELMIIPPNKKAEMIIGEIYKDEPNLNLINDLIALGANLDWQDKDNYNYTPLHLAIREESVEIARMLIDAGADLDVQDTWGSKTPLHDAALWRRIEIARMLIDAGASVDVQDNDGWTPLHWAARYGQVEIVKMLIDAGADVNVQNENGFTPLHWAAIKGNEEIAQMLIDAGARKDIPNNRGKLPYDLTTNQELQNLLKP